MLQAALFLGEFVPAPPGGRAVSMPPQAAVPPVDVVPAPMARGGVRAAAAPPMRDLESVTSMSSSMADMSMLLHTMASASASEAPGMGIGTGMGFGTGMGSTATVTDDSLYNDWTPPMSPTHGNAATAAAPAFASTAGSLAVPLSPISSPRVPSYAVAAPAVAAPALTTHRRQAVPGLSQVVETGDVSRADIQAKVLFLEGLRGPQPPARSIAAVRRRVTAFQQLPRRRHRLRQLLQSEATFLR